MGQFNYTITYKPEKQNMAADALSHCPDYIKQPSKRIHFADEMGFPLCEVRELTKSTESGFVEVIPGTWVLESSTSNTCSTGESMGGTCGSKISTSGGIEGTASGEVQSDGTKFST